MTFSRFTSFLVVIRIACMCIIVVGTIIAIVVIEIWGSTVWTSGPWWLGTVTGSRTTASIGPFLISPGSDPLRTMIAWTWATPNSLSISWMIRQRPVVLQETTRTNCRPMASAKLQDELKENPATSW